MELVSKNFNQNNFDQEPQWGTPKTKHTGGGGWLEDLSQKISIQKYQY